THTHTHIRATHRHVPDPQNIYTHTHTSRPLISMQPRLTTLIRSYTAPHKHTHTSGPLIGMYQTLTTFIRTHTHQDHSYACTRPSQHSYAHTHIRTFTSDSPERWR